MTASLFGCRQCQSAGIEACQRTIAVFDGRMRYDLRQLQARGSDQRRRRLFRLRGRVRRQFCSARGTQSHRSAIKYLVDQRDMEMWLAPIAARIVVPFRVSVPTPIEWALCRRRNSSRSRSRRARGATARRSDRRAALAWYAVIHRAGRPLAARRSCRVAAAPRVWREINNFGKVSAPSKITPHFIVERGAGTQMS
jgi:hypothetical protein